MTVVQTVIRDYQPEGRSAATADDEHVLVKVKVTSGKEFSGSVGDGDFRIFEPVEDIGRVSTSVVETQMTADGYPPLQDARNGASAEGWMVFRLSEDRKPGLKFVYLRLAAKVIGSDKTISRMEFPITLPDA